VLPPTAVQALRDWQAAQGAGATPEAPVFPGRFGEPVSPSTVGAWVATAFRRPGIKRPWQNAHALRRTFAAEFLRRHPDQLRRLQVLMRHENIATTVLYDYPEAEDLRGAVAALPL
jgi:site-specific recombinase XerC